MHPKTWQQWVWRYNPLYAPHRFDRGLPPKPKNLNSDDGPYVYDPKENPGLYNYNDVPFGNKALPRISRPDMKRYFHEHQNIAGYGRNGLNGRKVPNAQRARDLPAQAMHALKAFLSNTRNKVPDGSLLARNLDAIRHELESDPDTAMGKAEEYLKTMQELKKELRRRYDTIEHELKGWVKIAQDPHVQDSVRGGIELAIRDALEDPMRALEEHLGAVEREILQRRTGRAVRPDSEASVTNIAPYAFGELGTIFGPYSGNEANAPNPEEALYQERYKQAKWLCAALGVALVAVSGVSLGVYLNEQKRRRDKGRR